MRIPIHKFTFAILMLVIVALVAVFTNGCGERTPTNFTTDAQLLSVPPGLASCGPSQLGLVPAPNIAERDLTNLTAKQTLEINAWLAQVVMRGDDDQPSKGEAPGDDDSPNILRPPEGAYGDCDGGETCHTVYDTVLIINRDGDLEVLKVKLTQCTNECGGTQFIVETHDNCYTVDPWTGHVEPCNEQ